MKTAVIAVAGTALVTAGIVVGAAGTASAATAPTALPRAHGFPVDCAFSHTGTTDPIVMPGMTGMSHQHEFFGNTTTNESTTGDSLITGGTTCQDPNDHSAYWVPALLWNGTRVEPRNMHIRYAVTGPGVTPFPTGFKAVTGRTDSTATWGCAMPGGEQTTSGSVATVPTCAQGQHLVASVIFGDCWDGSSLDSANHASHLVAGSSGQCPSDHPVRVPQVTLSVNYPAFVTGGSGVSLASGAASTLHGDIFEAWTNDGLAQRLSGPPAQNQAGPRPAPPNGPNPNGPNQAGPRPDANQAPPPPPPPGQGPGQGPGRPGPRR